MREAQRHVYGAELQQALELSTTENAVYDVVGRALREVVPQLDVELLIADSSNAHFRRVLSTNVDPDNAGGCGVISPRDCPAAIRGHTMEFPSSEAISACPHLRGRPTGACSAVCVPVSIAGNTVGVMHATGADGTLPERGRPREHRAQRPAQRRTGRVAAGLRQVRERRRAPIRSPACSTAAASRTRCASSQRDGIPYALAYGDLDFFKALNDTYGHETGDQALRLFARVLRDAVRPADLVSRYGGEEFVIVLPDCGIEAAVAVLERVRERLALALPSGRIPAFTVSFGVATSADAATFDAVVAAADQALLAAKSAGRDRVLLAELRGATAS